MSDAEVTQGGSLRQIRHCVPIGASIREIRPASRSASEGYGIGGSSATVERERNDRPGLERTTNWQSFSKARGSRQEGKSRKASSPIKKKSWVCAPYSCCSRRMVSME